MCGFLDLSDRLIMVPREVSEQVSPLCCERSHDVIEHFKSSHVVNAVRVELETIMLKEQQVHHILFELLTIVVHFTYGHTVLENLTSRRAQQERDFDWNIAGEYLYR